MDDKGEVKCIKFSIGNKILAVQRTSKSVVSLHRLTRPGYRGPTSHVTKKPQTREQMKSR